MKKTIAELTEEVSVFRLLYLLKSNGLTFPVALEVAANAYPTFREPLLKILKGVRSRRSLKDVFQENRDSFTEFVPYLFWEVTEADYDGGRIHERLWDAAVILGRLNQLRKNGVPEEKINEVYFYRIFGALLVSGVPCLSALTIAGEPYLGNLGTNALVGSFKQGESLFVTMESDPKHFDKMASTMILAGELTGATPIVCQRIAELKEDMLLLTCTIQQLPNAVKDAAIEDMLVYQQFGVFLESGLPVNRALDYFSANVPGDAKKKTFGIITESVARGESLADAITGAFPSYAQSLIEQGERSGELETTFYRLADYLRWELFDTLPTYQVPKLEEV